jgi:hypothetical protein
MVDRPRVVSAFDAKTRLSELLRETEQGASFIIERRGKGSAGLELGEVLDCFRRIRESIPGTVSVRALVEEGRRI